MSRDSSAASSNPTGFREWGFLASGGAAGEAPVVHLAAVKAEADAAEAATVHLTNKEKSMKTRIAILTACASMLIASVFVGTVPAKADGWDYAWYNGRCYMIAHPLGSNAAYLKALPNPPFWGPATSDRCKNHPVSANQVPFALMVPGGRQQGGQQLPSRGGPMPIGR